MIFSPEMSSELGSHWSLRSCYIHSLRGQSYPFSESMHTIRERTPDGNMDVYLDYESTYLII